jgi:hypothetical protein
MSGPVSRTRDIIAPALDRVLTFSALALDSAKYASPVTKSLFDVSSCGQ